jgi:outer membrane cobalamin receptor
VNYSGKEMRINNFSVELKKIYLAVMGIFISFFVMAQDIPDSLVIHNKVHLIDEVTVTGTRYETDVRNLPMSISVVSGIQMTDRQNQSVLPVLNEQVPGLFISSRGIMGYGVSTGAAGAMKMRGIGGNPTTGLLMLIDGEPQYMGLMGHPVADVYQTILADRIEVVRGPASVLYGSNAMGGVINIVTAKPDRDTIQNNVSVGYGSYNTIESSFSNLLQKGRFNGKTALSYDRTDGHRGNMDFDRYSGYTKLGYHISKDWNVNTYLILSHFNASNPGTVANPITDNDSHITRGMTNLSFENNYSKTSGAVKLYFNWGYHTINDGYSLGGQPRDYRFHSKDQMSGFSWYQSATVLPNNRITIGVDYQLFGGKALNRYTNKSESVIIDTTLSEYAVYADLRQTVGLLLTFDAGLRYDRHTQTGSQWIPQVGLSVHLPKALEMKAMVSKGFRNPTIRELFMFPTQNRNLLPENLLNYELSFSQHILKNNLSYSLSVFFMDGKNMIQTVIVNGRPMNVNSAEIKNHGIEASVNYKMNPKWAVNSNYSWLSMKYPVVAAPRHKAFAGIDYTNVKIRVSTGIQYIRDLYTSIQPGQKQTFVLWNFRAGYQLTKSVNPFMSGENLLGQSYEINAGYPMPKATFTLGVHIRF